VVYDVSPGRIQQEKENAHEAVVAVLLIAAHSERHTAQIEEVKTHANYPKK
jgi:hypothetical protein